MLGNHALVADIHAMKQALGGSGPWKKLAEDSRLRVKVALKLSWSPGSPSPTLVDIRVQGYLLPSSGCIVSHSPSPSSSRSGRSKNLSWSWALPDSFDVESIGGRLANQHSKVLFHPHDPSLDVLQALETSRTSTTEMSPLQDSKGKGRARY